MQAKMQATLFNLKVFKLNILKKTYKLIIGTKFYLYQIRHRKVQLFYRLCPEQIV